MQLQPKRKKRIKITENLIRLLLTFSALLTVFTTIAIVLVLLSETLSFFKEVSIIEFITGTKWTPQYAEKHFGILPLINGTLLVTVLACLIAMPIGLGSAIYLSEYAPDRVRRIVKPILEVLAGIPTIVYGYFALTFVTPLIRVFLPETSIYNALSASIVMGIMILPMVASLSEDAMIAVPRKLRDGAYALGATRFEVALKVVVPAALSGIISSFVLAFSRAVGETMIVTVAAGALAQLTLNPLESVQTMTAFIVNISLGDVPHGSIESRSIFAVGMTLFAITLVMNRIAQTISRRYKEEY